MGQGALTPAPHHNTRITGLTLRILHIRKKWPTNTNKATSRYLTHCQNELELAKTTTAFYSWALRRLELGCQTLPKTHRDLWPVVNDPALAIESRRDLRRALNTFFKWVEQEYGRPNPMAGLDQLPPQRLLPRVFTPEELGAIADSCGSARDYGLVAVVLDNGIRLGEVTSLTKQSLGPGYLRVDGKTGQRQVPLSEQVNDLLRTLGDSRFVWTGKKGRLTRPGVQQVYRRLFRRAGLTGRKLGPHTLRHTFGTMYCRAGGNIRVLQEIMGHSDLETTMIYVHLAGLDVAGDHALHSPVKILGEFNPQA